MIARKSKLDKNLVCERTGELVDRDINAALNLRDWPQSQPIGPVRSEAPTGSPEDLRASRVGGPDDTLDVTPGEVTVRRTASAPTPDTDEARTKTSQEEQAR